MDFNLSNIAGSLLNRHDFEPAIENAFQTSLDRPRRHSTQVGAWLAIVLFAGFSLLDIWAIPESLIPVLAIRWLLTVPLLLFVIWTTRQDFFTRHYRSLMILTYGGMGLSIEAMIIMASPSEVAAFTYYAGLILVVIALYTWTYLKPVEAAIIGFGLVFIYAGIEGIQLITATELERSSQGGVVLMANLFFFISASVIGLVAAAIREQHLRQIFLLSRQAEALAQAKGTFLANMSHEIRTPLNGMIGMAHLIRKEALSAEQTGRLDKLETSAHHLLQILNAILDLSKIEAGKFTLENTAIQPVTVVANIVSILDEQARTKGLQLLTEVDSLPQNLLGDATRLQQALLNYVNNAIKFTDHGTVKIRVKLCEESTENVLLRFEVCDSGIGIAPEAMQRLFSHFEQADASTTRKYGGSGLGLAITQKLAELMGGAAGGESHAGVGSTFWFTARLTKDLNASSAHVALIAEDAGIILQRDFAGTHVLLAEDNEINREVASAILEDVAFMVETAEDGVEAVAMATQKDYPLILMDMQMPRMDGLEATRQIRTLKTGGKVAIIAMTANAFKEDKDRCIAAGMDDFISKPVMPEELYAVILKWLREKQEEKT